MCKKTYLDAAMEARCPCLTILPCMIVGSNVLPGNIIWPPVRFENSFPPSNKVDVYHKEHEEHHNQQDTM